MIQKESKTDWEEMYKVFNMGHRMELYLTEEYASEIIAISKRFGVDAKVIGRVESAAKAQVTIDGEKYVYTKNFIFFVLSIRITYFALRSLNIGEVPERPKGLVC